MKLKISLVAVLVCVYQISFSQVNKSKKTIVSDASEKEVLTDQKKDNSKKHPTQNNNVHYEDVVYNDEQWEEIKSQIKANKERLTNSNEVIISKVIDTVFIEIPVKYEPQLSSW